MADSLKDGNSPTVNEDLLTAFSANRETAIRVYEPSDVSVVLGAGGDVHRDCLVEQIRMAGVSILRRRGGGGTVVLSPGMVVAALVTDVDSPFHNNAYVLEIHERIAQVLRDLGVTNVEHRGVSDLTLCDRKILGASVYRRRTILFYQSSLLVGNDLALFTRYLRMPHRKPAYRGNRDHEQFCTTLNQEGYSITPRSLVCAIRCALTD